MGRSGQSDKVEGAMMIARRCLRNKEPPVVFYSRRSRELGAALPLPPASSVALLHPRLPHTGSAVPPRSRGSSMP
jgi:hypothetical protein